MSRQTILHPLCRHNLSLFQLSQVSRRWCSCSQVNRPTKVEASSSLMVLFPTFREFHWHWNFYVFLLISMNSFRFFDRPLFHGFDFLSGSSSASHLILCKIRTVENYLQNLADWEITEHCLSLCAHCNHSHPLCTNLLFPHGFLERSNILQSLF